MKTIELDNGWEFVWPGTQRNTATGKSEAAAGLLTLFARISATDGGAAINAALEKTLAERADTPGEYFAVVDGAVLRTHLAALTGQVVYEVFGDGANVRYSVPRRVLATRRP